MRKLKDKPGLVRWVLVVSSLALIILLLAQYPPINRRLSWRVDRVLIYLNGVIRPAREMPTPPPHSTETPLVASAPVQTDAPSTTKAMDSPSPTSLPTPVPTALPGSVALPTTAYESQDMNNCGPATLSMYLRFYGWEGDQFDIAKLVKPERKDRNVNVDELIYFVRNRAGWLNAEFRVGGDLEILKKFLAAGIPVMIEEGFHLEESFWPNDDRWAGHYLLLTGYDEATQTFTVQDSFREPVKTVSYQSLEQNWQAFNYLYILAYRPEQADTVRALLGEDWDPDINRQNALEKAQAQTEADPKNAYAWFNLGSNLVYFERYNDAAQAYDSARNIGLPQRMLLYQFGPYFAYFHSVRNDDLLALTEYILDLPSKPYSEEAHLWHGWGLYRAGDTSGAIADFRLALEDNPNYQDAKYALDFVGASP